MPATSASSSQAKLGWMPLRHQRPQLTRESGELGPLSTLRGSPRTPPRGRPPGEKIPRLRNQPTALSGLHGPASDGVQVCLGWHFLGWTGGFERVGPEHDQDTVVSFVSRSGFCDCFTAGALEPKEFCFFVDRA